MSLTEALSYDLTMQNPLFDDNLTTMPDNHVLVTELEKNLSSSHYNFQRDSEKKTTLIRKIRKMPFFKFHMFRDAFEAVWNTMQSIC